MLTATRGSVGGLHIAPVAPQSAEALALLHEAALEARRLYADLIDPAAPLPGNGPAVPRSVYLVARLGGRAVGCGALRPLDADAGEVRRIYVQPAARRLGVGSAVLQALEAHARRLGFRRLLLETGTRQAPARALSAASGCVRTAPFGPHVGDPTSVCFAKRL